MAEQFHREYLYRLPLPLAQLYGRAYNAKDARGRHDNSFYLFEAFVKLAATPLVACYLAEIEAGTPRVAALDRLLAQLALPSLGQWVQILRELARHFGTRPDAASHPLGHVWPQLSQAHRDAPALLSLYRRIRNGPDAAPAGDQSCSLMQVLDALVHYRNDVFGHGAGRSEAFYDTQMGPLLFPAADELLAEGMIEPLGPRGSRLLYLTQIRTLESEQVEVAVREVIGLQTERSSPLTLTRLEAQGLAPNLVVLLWPGRKLPLRLDPLLVYRESETSEEVLFLNRGRNNRQVEYLSYTTGRTERDAGTAASLAKLLSRVTGQSISTQQLDTLAQQSLSETPSVEALFAQPDPAGQILGDFELLAEIGRGGMGMVYLARQLSLGRLVALKMLPADLEGDEVSLARFRREMRALARCDHPNIVKVLSNGIMPDGRLYYAMEYVPGCDLEQVWRELSREGKSASGGASKLGDTTFARAVITASRKKREQASKTRSADDVGPDASGKIPPLPLPPLAEIPSAEGDPGGYVRRVASLIRDAALALQAVHDQQIVHRDVKPANLMLTSDGSRVVLMDFGLAKGQSLQLTASRAGGLLGTLRYAAPEQLAAASLKVGPAADVRGLGVVLWELLTCRRLFAEAEDEQRLTQWVLTRDIPKLRAVDPTFDADLEAIVAKATERDATERIASASKLAEYLQLWLEGKPLPIRSPTTAELVWRWVREHRKLVASTTTAVALIVLTVTIAFTIVNRERREKTSLADEKSRLADEKSKLAERNGALAQEKGKLAADNAALVEHLKLQSSDSDFAVGNLLCQEGKDVQALPYLARALRTNPRNGGAMADSVAILLRIRIPIAIVSHRDRVTCASFSPDGTRVVTASWDNTARVWDAATGKPLGEPMRHEESINSAAFSPDGTRVVTASSDYTARVWDVAIAGQVCPAWLADLNELAAQHRLNPSSGVLESFDLQAAHDNLVKLAGTIAPNDPEARWLRWFLADPRTRTISPLSDITVSEYVQRRVDENTAASLRLALEIDPNHPRALARLGRHIAQDVAEKKNPGWEIYANLYTRRALELSPADTEIQALRERVLDILRAASASHEPATRPSTLPSP